MTERVSAKDLHAMQASAGGARKRRRDVEGPVHKAILQYLRLALPDSAVIHHSPNEMSIAGDRRAKAIAQSKAKALGMMPGWPDIEIICGGFYAIEVKAERGVQSPEQIRAGGAIQKAGGHYGVARSVTDAERLLAEWRLIT